MLWLMGDFLSFTSCIININTVLKFQLYISVFFLCNDIILCFQYYHYNYVHPRYTYVEMNQQQDDNDNEIENENEDEDEELPKSPIDSEDFSIYQDHDIHWINHAQNMDQTISEDYLTSDPSSYDSTNEDGGRNMVFNGSGIGIVKKSIVGTLIQAGRTVALPLSNTITISNSDTNDSLGLYLAWGGAIVYCLSRCPQVYKNYRRKSVEGISPLLFGAALLGNLTYTLSILLSCEFYQGEEIRHNFIIKELPYILGSSGTIVFDMTYFIQKFMYNTNTRSERRANTMAMESWDDIETRHSNRS